jgi:hypothetical protein
MQPLAFLWFELQIIQQQLREKTFPPGGDGQCCPSGKVGLKNKDYHGGINGASSKQSGPDPELENTTATSGRPRNALQY